MKKLIHWPSLLIGLGVAALIAVLVDAFTALGFWPIFVIAVVAILVNGVVATVEDEMPGGFNNPGPASPLPLVAPQRWKLWLCEPPRDLTRLQLLREWSHEQDKHVLPRGARACRSDGAGASR